MTFLEGGSLLPVTSLEFATVSGEEILLSGEGPNLKAFSKDGEFLWGGEVLPFCVIHGMKALQNESGSESLPTLLLVFGQKAFRLLELVKDDTMRLVRACEVVHLTDWLLDVVWLNWKGPTNYLVVALTAHNVLVKYERVEGKVATTQYQNEVSCILYSALVLGSCLDDLMIVSGTVFNKVLLWHVREESPGPKSCVCVRVSYAGHQGVIFSVKVNSEQSKLISASDDRTVRVWGIPADWKTQTRLSESNCLLVLYGHTARVWLAKLLPQCIVSVGEDAACRVWGHDGKILTTFRGHKGKSIWSMAVDRQRALLATGGGDCSIRVYSLTAISRPSSIFHSWSLSGRPPEMPRCAETTENLLKTTHPEVPRCVFLLGPTALCLTDQGSLLIGQGWRGAGEAVWSEVHHDSQFSGYSVGAVSPHGSRILAFGNIRGALKLMKLEENGSVLASVIVMAYRGKVFSLNWTLSQGVCRYKELLFSCGPDGSIICWEVKCDPLAAQKLACFILPVSKHRWITTVSILSHPDLHTTHHLVVCGDRKGSLHLYKLIPGDLRSSEPCQSLLGVHGPNGVTYSCIHDALIYTCGRNGLCRKFKVGDTKLVELTTFKPVKGLDWIDKILFTQADMLVLGFHGANLMMYSTEQNRRLLDVACGGGHRSYTISALEEICAQRSARLVFIKQAEICYGEMELENYFTRSLFQQAFVGLEAASLLVLDRDFETGRGVVAIGSEDCSVCLLRLRPAESPSSRPVAASSHPVGRNSAAYHSSRQLGSSQSHQPATSQSGEPLDSSGSSEPHFCGGIPLQVIHTLQGHASCVKALSTSRSAAKRLLFSGGARASLKVWSIGEDCGDVCLESGLFLYDNLQMKRRKKRAKSKPLGPEFLPECRVMALASFPLCEVFRGSPEADLVQALHFVAAGCSDALIRQYVYNEKARTFSSLQSLKSSDNCVLCLKHFLHQDSPRGNSEGPPPPSSCYPILLSAGTDGQINVWSIQEFLSHWLCGHHHPPQPPPTLEQPSLPLLLPVASFRLHQSGVNDMAVQTEARSGESPVHALVSVGDDNALALTFLAVTIGSHGALSVVQGHTHTHFTAHSSAITGVCFAGEGVVMTTSTDQRLNVWKVSGEGGGIELLSSHAHDVADPSSLAVYNTRRDGTVVVLCGVGLQYYTYISREQTKPS